MTPAVIRAVAISETHAVATRSVNLRAIDISAGCHKRYRLQHRRTVIQVAQAHGARARSISCATLRTDLPMFQRRLSDTRKYVAEAVYKAERVVLSRELSAFLVEISIALHKHAMYPAGHPSLEPA